MRGRLRNKNRKQSQAEQLFQEQRFDVGWINDLPASDIPKGGMALLENFNGYPEYIEGRSGSQKFSDTVLPGSGTVFSLKQHPTSKKWVLHRADKVYYADAAMATWTQLYYHALVIGSSPTIAGDASAQLSALTLNHTSTSNTNAGVLYWNLTNSGSTRTLNVYKDLAKSNLVAVATRVGNGAANFLQKNNSGITGQVTITYTTDDSDAANTFTGSVETANGLGSSKYSTLRPVGNDFYLFTQGPQYPYSPAYDTDLYIDLTNNKLIIINGSSNLGYGGATITGAGSQAAATPYGYRYVYCLSRIIDNTTAAADYTLNRVSGTLVYESPSNSIGGESGLNTGKDYAEFWVASAITASSTNAIIATELGTVTTPVVTYRVAPHYTHISLYRTMDIGISGTDPVTGSGNNREIFVWIGDYDITSTTITDTKSDDELRAAFAAGFGLKTRFWRELPYGELGEITNNFIYKGARGENKISYGQLADKTHIGFYNPAYQYFKLDDGAQVIAKSPDMISFICSNKTYISNPNSYFDASGGAIAPTYVLNHLTVASENIGVTDYGSFAPMDNAFVAHCSDHTVRIWNSSYWSDDIASRRINQIVRIMAYGSVGVYGAGAYYLFYKVNSGLTTNTLCLRYGFSREAGFGWSKVSGAAWPVLPSYVGATQIMDSNNLQRIIVYDAVDTYCYWIETFTGQSASSTTKYFKDKVATNGTGGTDIVCTARFREFTASDESLDLFHKESYIYDRPYDEATGYPTGFSRTLKAYLDGSTTAAATLTAAPAKGDLQFYDKVSGNRLQMEVQFATSGARLTGIATLCDVFDRAAIGSRPSDGSDAAAQLALASNLKHWLTRPNNLLDRATGVSYTLTGTAPTNVTGPDNRTYALSFVSGDYSLPDTTMYTDFTLFFWCKSVTSLKRVIRLDGPSASLSIEFTTNTVMNVGGFGNITVNTIASGWHHFAIVRSGSTVTVYQNGTLLAGTVTVTLSRGGTAFKVNMDDGAMSLYDIRLYNTALAAASITYYYADVNTTLEGKKVLPLA